MMTDMIYTQTKAALKELFQAADTLKKGDIIVVGCSTSEVMGKMIGSASSADAAREILRAIEEMLSDKEYFFAAQCCEHLNRALVVERRCMERYDLQQVWVRPQPHAGGAFASLAYERIPDAVVVEDLHAKAAAGIDIGGTLIGMHLHPVVVPVHTSNRNIGEARVNIAKTRPKYIGGPRALYEDMKAK